MDFTKYTESELENTLCDFELYLASRRKIVLDRPEKLQQYYVRIVTAIKKELNRRDKKGKKDKIY